MKNISRAALSWLAGGVVLALAILAGTYFLIVGPKRAEASNARDHVMAAEATAAQLRQKLARLKQQEKNLASYQSELAEIQQSMPAEVNQPQLLRDINAIAKETKVSLDQLQPGTPTPVADPKTKAAGQVVTSGTTSAKNAAASSAGQLYSVPIALNVVGSFAQTEAFLRTLQTKLSRAILIETVDVSTSGAQAKKRQDGSTGSAFELQTSLSGKLFILTKQIPNPAAGQTGQTQPVPTAQPTTGTTGSTPAPNGGQPTATNTSTSQGAGQ